MLKKGCSRRAKQYKSLIFFLLKIALGASCIFLMYREGFWDVDVLLGAILTSPYNVLAGFFLVCAMIFLGITRWYFVMRMTGVPFSFANSLAVGLIGIFFATFAPGGVTSDVMRSYYSSRDKKFSVDSMLAVAIDRGGALCGQLLTVVLFGLLIFDKISGSVFEIPFFVMIALFVGLVLFAVSFYLDFFSKFFRRLGKSGDYLQNVQQKPFAFVLATIISSVNSILLGVSLFVFAGAVVETMEVGLGYFLFAGPFVAISLTIPLTPAGLGTGQIAGLLLFNNMTNQAISCGAEIVTLVQLSWMIVGLFGVLVFVVYKKQGEVK